MISLRPYQHRAIYEELLPWFAENPEGNPIMAACVGAGKSVMIAEMCRHAVLDFPEYRSRILMLVPSKELLEQNFAKISPFAGHVKIGIISASAGRKDVAFNKDVIIATVGSVAKNPGALGRLDLILVDECHLIPRAHTGQYRKLIADCAKYNPALRVIGLTGTPYRGNGIWLTAGEDRLFTDVAARVTMRELLDEGFLSPLVTADTGIHVSGENVGMRDGDFIVSELAKVLDKDALTQDIARQICDLGRDRAKWMVYGATVKHATHLSEAIRGNGFTAEVVSAETPKGERERLIRMFRSGHIRALVNVAVLTTGFDVPELDLIALVRNTRSPVLYTQIAGRGMRIADGKTDCLWLDFTDTTETLGPVDLVKGRPEPKPPNQKKSSSPTYKICPECGASNGGADLICKTCGHEFPLPEPKINGHASAAQIMGNGETEIVDVPVYRVTYAKHRKEGKPDSLRVTYWGPLRPIVSEWVCIEHERYARAKAEKWWRERWAGNIQLPVPGTIDDALGMTKWLKTPTRITVKNGGEWPELIRCNFDETIDDVFEEFVASYFEDDIAF